MLNHHTPRVAGFTGQKISPAIGKRPQVSTETLSCPAVCCTALAKEDIVTRLSFSRLLVHCKSFNHTALYVPYGFELKGYGPLRLYMRINFVIRGPVSLTLMLLWQRLRTCLESTHLRQVVTFQVILRSLRQSADSEFEYVHL